MSQSRTLPTPTPILRIFQFIEEWIPATLMAVMTISISSDVVMRYVFHRPLAGAGELAMVSMVWLVFLGSAGVSRLGAHICLDFFSVRLSGKGRAVLDIVVEIITITVLLAITIATIQYLNSARFVTLPGTGISKQYVTLAAAIGLILMLFHTAVHLLRAMIGLRDPNYSRLNVSIEEVELDEFDTQFINAVDEELSGKKAD